MAIEIRKTDGSLLTTIDNGRGDTTSTSLILFGKDYISYAKPAAENFVKILENFSSSVSPSNPLDGQLWHHKTKNGNRLGLIKVYDSINTRWDAVSTVVKNTVAPATPNTLGNLWYNTVDNSLSYYKINSSPNDTTDFFESGGTWQKLRSTNNNDFVVTFPVTAGDGIRVINSEAPTQVASLIRLGSNYNYNGTTGQGSLLYSFDKLTIMADTNNPIVFSTGAQEVARITSTGKLGIGIANPVGTIDVVKTTENPSVRLRSNISDYSIGCDFQLKRFFVYDVLSAYDIINHVGDFLRIAAVPNGGGGSGLTVSNALDGNQFIGVERTTSTYSFGGIIGQGGQIKSADRLALVAGNNNPIVFSTGGSEKARLTSTGKLGIGTNNPSSGIHIVGDASLRLQQNGFSDYLVYSSNTSNKFAVYDVPAARDVLAFSSSVFTTYGSSIAVREPSDNIKSIFLERNPPDYNYNGITGIGGLVYSYDRLAIMADTNNPIEFSAGAVKKMSITANNGTIFEDNTVFKEQQRGKVYGVIPSPGTLSFPPLQAGLIKIYGQTGPGGLEFSDVVNFIVGNRDVISSVNNGGCATRTYGQDGSGYLTVSLSGGAALDYTITAISFN